MKGCICLDIDGTITTEAFHIPEEVVKCFESLHSKGWKFLFSTGRPYAYAARIFHNFKFPFYLSLQNGADILEMPEKKVISKAHLSANFVRDLDEIYKEMEEDYLIYSGLEKGDFCYYRPQRFSPKALEHLEVVQSIVPEPWEGVEEFSFSEKDTFPLIKGLGSKEQMQFLFDKLKPYKEIYSTLIIDPLSRKSSGVHTYLNLITSKHATKGEVVKRIRSLLPEGTHFIAAGDDRNDIPMLEEADFAIVMKNAPEDLLTLADLIAEPAENMGIIQALFKATGEKV